MEPTNSTTSEIQPLSHKEQVEQDLNNHYADLEKFFGQDIFALPKEDQEKLFAEKSSKGERPDFLKIRMTLESKIRILEKSLEKDPDDEELSNKISVLLKQDVALDNLYKLRNA